MRLAMKQYNKKKDVNKNINLLIKKRDWANVAEFQIDLNRWKIQVDDLIFKFNHINRKKINIEFNYPLDISVVKEFQSKSGFDVFKILSCVNDGYVDIYKNSKKYGIWGHCLEELVVENMLYNKKKNLITLHIGS
jgi:hypothetical protein